MRAARPAPGSLADCPLLATRPGYHGPCHRGHARCVGIDWMEVLELAQAIPPAYTHFVGEHLLAAVKAAAL